MSSPSPACRSRPCRGSRGRWGPQSARSPRCPRQASFAPEVRHDGDVGGLLRRTGPDLVQVFDGERGAGGDVERGRCAELGTRLGRREPYGLVFRENYGGLTAGFEGQKLYSRGRADAQCREVSGADRGEFAYLGRPAHRHLDGRVVPVVVILGLDDLFGLGSEVDVAHEVPFFTALETCPTVCWTTVPLVMRNRPPTTR